MPSRQIVTGLAALLVGICACIGAVLSANAFRFSGPAAQPAFYGNRNITVSAIDVSGGIVASRSGTISTPAFIQVAASAVTATGTSRPFEDLQFTWDFGDPSGVETLTNPFTSQSVNANNGQIGPEAAYVYRSAGTYTITLTATGYNPARGNIVAATTMQVTVAAFNPTGGERYADSAATPGGDGLSPATAWSAWSDVTTFINGSTTARIVHLARGSAWTTTTTTNFKGNLRIDAYGSGAKPQLTLNASGSSSIYALSSITSSTGTGDNIVISNMAIVVAGSVTGSAALEGIHVLAQSPSTRKDIYVDLCDFTITGTAANIGALALSIQNGDVEGDIGSANGLAWRVTVTSTQPTHSSMYFLINYFGGSVGTVMSAPIANTHYTYASIHNHLLYRWNSNSTPGAITDGYSLNPSLKGSGQGGTVNGAYLNVSDNYFSGSQFGVDVSNSTNDTTTLFNNVLIERNSFAAMSQTAMTINSVQNITIRGNHAWNGFRYVVIASALANIMSLKIDDNLAYFDGSVASVFISGWQGATFSLYQEMTGNAVSSLRTGTVSLYRIKSADAVAGNWPVNNNQYYVPNATGAPTASFIEDNGSNITLSTAKSRGIEAFTLYGNPCWSDPANGNFARTC